MRIMKTVFAELGIPYLIGGSIASSIHGFPRTTHDVDFVADVKDQHVPALVAALETDCYLDDELMYDAIRDRSMFSVLHLSSMHKADVFLVQATPWAAETLARRREKVFRLGEDEEVIYVASPEDMVLQKLIWFRMGGGVSDRQWGDITGMLKVQAEKLDYAYLRRWANTLGLSELLNQALSDSGIELPPAEA